MNRLDAVVQVPVASFLRLRDIIGDAEAVPPKRALIPVSESTWWRGVRTGRYPSPVRSLGRRITAWRTEDILQFIAAQKRHSESRQTGKER